MAKKAAKAKSQAPDWMKPRFEGKKVCFLGRFDSYRHKWCTLDNMTRSVLDEGGESTKKLTAGVDYLVLKEPTGASNHEMNAAKLNAKGASITVLSTQQLQEMLTPTKQVVLALIDAGTQGHKRFSQLLRNAGIYNNTLTPAFILNQLDLHGQDLSSLPLWWIGLKNSDLRDCTLLSKEDEIRPRVGPFEDCRFDGATIRAEFKKLVNCSCRNVTLTDSRLFGGPVISEFSNSRLTACHFGYTKLSKSNFSNCDLTNSIFESCEVTKCHFEGARLNSIRADMTEFSDSDFSNADFSDANLNGISFSGCNLSGAKFCRAMMTNASLRNATLDGTDFTDANVAGVDFEGSDKSKARGLTRQLVRKIHAGPKLTELSGIAKKGKSFDTTIELETCSVPVQLAVSLSYQSYYTSWSKDFGFSRHKDFKAVLKTAADAFIAAAECWPDATPLISSVTASGKGLGIGQTKLTALVREAWCETYGIAVPDEDTLVIERNSIETSKQAKRFALLSMIDEPDGISNWNTKFDFKWTELNPFRGLDLSKRNLNGITLRGFSLEECRFNDSTIVGADLTFCSIKDSTFLNASLLNADFCETDLRSVNLTGAKLSTDPDLWENTTFDEATVFPKGFKIPATLKWKGKGIDPRAAKVLKSAKIKGPIDIDQFMQLLQASVDKDRLKKATTMLKAERFRLFAQAADDHLAGVVKSQNDPDLVYSCRPTKDGNFSCCTQNLNVCGGLRGALCKHLLVLIIGMTKGGELDPTTVNQWIQASRYKKPELDKDTMGETLLRYKGAEAGDVDWRPMETIPEDYYSL